MIWNENPLLHGVTSLFRPGIISDGDHRVEGPRWLFRDNTHGFDYSAAWESVHWSRKGPQTACAV
jgi:hypothetical protein